MAINVSANKEKFVNGLKKILETRDPVGVEKLTSWLEHTDFFTAPASTKYHLCEEGGLCAHSINVFKCLLEDGVKLMGSDDATVESFAVCGFLHDICKTNYYKIAYRNVKNEQGVWEKVPYYTVDDQFPYGHGEKSVFLIERFMRLKPAEAIAIRWHMGAFDDAAQGGALNMLSSAFSMNPLAVCLHLADMRATYFEDVKVRKSEEQDKDKE